MAKKYLFPVHTQRQRISLEWISHLTRTVGAKRLQLRTFVLLINCRSLEAHQNLLMQIICLMFLLVLVEGVILTSSDFLYLKPFLNLQDEQSFSTTLS